jgi:acyl-CoA dehydrogenase
VRTVSGSGVFDLTPTDDQQMLVDVGSDFAARVVRAAGAEANEACVAPGSLRKASLEKWARDSKILDIFEGTRQIQQLIVARRILGLSSAELK